MKKFIGFITIVMMVLIGVIACDTEQSSSVVSGVTVISIVWKGEAETAPENPQTNWAYYNTADKKSYIYDGKQWQILAQDGKNGHDGQNGQDGQNGNDGISIVWQGNLASAPDSPQTGWAYYNAVDKKSYIWNGSAWNILAQDGAAGGEGQGSNTTIEVCVTWKGSLDAAPNDPVAGWAYYNTAEKKSYIYDGTNWNILAQDGADGQNGQNGQDGQDANIWTIGDDGYWYLNGVKTEYLSKGADGQDGQNGQDGQDADVWTIGNDGYWYLNGVKTEYQSKGADGQNGQNGHDGTNGTDGTSIIWKGSLDAAPSSPVVGWAYYNMAEKKSYIYDGTNWNILAQDGADGQNGQNGQDGQDANIWTIGDDGYWYLNGEKTEYMSKGADGQDGQNGQDGQDADIWTIGNDGYWYLNGEKTNYMSKGADGQDGQNGHDGQDGTNGSDGISIVWKGSLSAAPNNPELNWAYYNTSEKKSYIYDGTNWQILAQDGQDVTTDVHVPSYTIIFSANGGTGYMPKMVCEIGQTYNVPECEFTAPTQSDFSGWDLLQGEETFCNLSTTDGDIIVVTAQWTPKQYDIIYKDESGDDFSGEYGNKTPMVHTYGTVTSLVTPVRFGWIFVGWYATSACDGQALTELGATDYTGNITLYAKWSWGFECHAAELKTKLSLLDPEQGPYKIYIIDYIPNLTVIKAALLSNNTVTVDLDMSRCECLTTVETEAFIGCSNLTSVTIPDSVTNIGGSAFQDCSGLKTLVIGSGVTSIPEGLLKGCSGLESITIPDSVTSIGIGAFSGCSSLESIKIPFVGDKPHKSTDTYQYPFGYIFGIDSYDGGTATQQSYYGSSTSRPTPTTYYIPTSLKSVIITGSSYIPYGAFFNCTGLTSLTIGNSVTSICEYAFYECSGLTSVTIPDGVTSIGRYTFWKCSDLTSVTIGNSVTSIGERAFGGCSGLTTLNDKATTPPSFGSDMLYNCSALTKIYVPTASVSIYKAASGWSSYADKIEGKDFE